MPALYDTLTVREHMEFIRRAYKVDNLSKVDELLERFELKDKEKKMGKELSKGMQQKVSICCALVHDPSVVIFDEPMVGLDPHAIKELKQVFIELKEQGKTVLISTHMIATKRNDAWDEGDKTLDELFFEITEGRAKEG